MSPDELLTRLPQRAEEAGLKEGGLAERALPILDEIRNWLEPYVYLRCLFAELPGAETVEAIEALLPGIIDKDQNRLCKPVVY